MKKLTKVLAGTVISAAAVFGTLSCTSMDLSGLLGTITSQLQTPTLAFKSIGIQGLDMEGITFKCNYDITNPYNVAVSLKSLAADISCNDSKVTSLSADEGISLAANGTKTNTFNFKLPYDAIIKLAQSYSSAKEGLPFSVAGKVGLDLSAVQALQNKSLSLPFSKNFDVPVIKPSFSLSSPKLVLPTLSELVDAFKNSGMTATKAASLASSIMNGSKIDSSVFDNVNLNLKLNFDLSVKNEGGSAWNYLLNSCAIKTGDSSLINLDAGDAKTISSANGTIPLTANINTLKAGKFIAQIINKSGTNPTFELQSGISFPNNSYASNLPLNYSKTIALSSFGVTKQ